MLGVEKERRVLLFLDPSSLARSLAARFAYHSNGELPQRLAVQGMWIYTGGFDVNRLRLRIKGQHVWRIIPYQS